MSSDQWSGKGWSIAVDGGQLTVARPKGDVTFQTANAPDFELRRRWFRSGLYNDGQEFVRLRGITKSDSTALMLAIRQFRLRDAVADASAWHRAALRLLARARAEQQWISTEAVDELLATRPDPGLIERIRLAKCEAAFNESQIDAVSFLDVDLNALVAERNEAITVAELSSRREFFDTIERTPLTDEQSRAVVCFDNRVQVLAAAGSGKTSVMVARAAYAVSRGFVAADRILLLAFNKDAAAELQRRVSERFAAAGIDSSGVRASNFHAFGLDVIGRATGEKPRLASWAEQGQDVRTVVRIVDELRNASPSFRYSWDLYRLLLANAPTKLDEHDPDGYDNTTTRSGYQTFAGEIVKSHGERVIANFLYLNGIEYVYERPYVVNVADATHSQYRPDFYYPGIDVWHEHWALDRNGDPPADFDGYADAMAWKRGTHAQNGTTLIETTWADVVFGDGLVKLEAELTRLGLTFDWNPDRPVEGKWAKQLKDEDLARFVRTFMTHVKSNSWTAEDLERRLASEQTSLAGFRTRRFLDVYWPIHAEWQQQLAADRSVDFEDMLVQAADHLETENVDCPYDLILVDEFQDASQSRARIVRGLVRKPGRFLLAVGDDWQSINRFAGADLSVMTGFAEWFGRGHQLALTTTFRCTQSICDVARTFVSKNPIQFSKPMRSAQGDGGVPVRVVPADNVAAALAEYLDELSAAVAAGDVPAGHDGTVSVDVLGRYGFERSVVPKPAPPNLQLTFRTVHKSKGLEADYVVIPNLTTGTYGFPSGIADDPVLDLAMPTPDAFPHAEERRLFYVALTRARREVVLIPRADRMSPFVAELLAEPDVIVTAADGLPAEICSRCGRGTMVEKSGRFGAFLGCSTFPACDNTRTM